MSSVPTSTESSVYEQLAELTDEQLVAVQSGDLDRLEQLAARWATLVAALPTDAPEHARAALERTVAGHDQIGVALRELRERLGQELAMTGRGRRTASGYGATSALPVSSHQA
jgi:hypothetical protein